MVRVIKYFILCCVPILFSCSGQYNIVGDTSAPLMDGRMLYLNTQSLKDNMRSLDSCEIIHGRFKFEGMVDSAMMGMLYMDNHCLIPVVIENAEISVKINEAEQKVIGGPLNNRMYKFLEEQYRLQNEITELTNQEAKMILSGKKHNHRFQNKSTMLYNKLERLETEFIQANYDNVLGYTFFILLCDKYNYPIMTTQIEEIWDNAPLKFRNREFVSDYIEAARANMQLFRKANVSVLRGAMH